ncbi:hypothetical protein Q9Q94_16275 [Uliginosibacterium sp. 31-16]|uniref:hypothetical protein n=1 Tax=Uliginosibacterium sp. 31-16 TaxID=3068315 RepID=UPI00273E8A00|nr:hypothetical protein [Uliginosibacterium sp. 31-16]MDP5241099.1 hypothetical protein [Uliginosibacterium sp. 31-16]
MEPLYRIVFSGEIREGLSPTKVQAHAAKSLNIALPQIERMFSGKLVVLKNNLSEEDALAYMARLSKLGMQAQMEQMPKAGGKSPRVTVVPPSVVRVPEPPQPKPVFSPPPPASPPRYPSAEESWLSSSSFANLARTHLNLARAEALLNNSEYTGSVPGKNADLPWPELNTDDDDEDDVHFPPAVEAPAPPEPAPAPMMAAEPAPEAAPPAAEPEPEPAVPVLPTNLVMQLDAGTGGSITLNGSFLCSHCGTLHQLQTRLQISPETD